MNDINNIKKQMESFEFTEENVIKANDLISRYPEGRQQSAVMPLLDLAQRQSGNWLPRAAMDYVADYLDMPYIKVYEVATFYTMYNLKPVGKKFVQVCTTTPCWLRGSDDVLKACKDELGIEAGETTEDGEFTVIEVECQGACVNAPMAVIDDGYFEDLTYDNMVALLKEIKAGKEIEAGPQTDRQTSCPSSGATTLLSFLANESEKEGV